MVKDPTTKRLIEVMTGSPPHGKSDDDGFNDELPGATHQAEMNNFGAVGRKWESFKNQKDSVRQAARLET